MATIQKLFNMRDTISTRRVVGLRASIACSGLRSLQGELSSYAHIEVTRSALCQGETLRSIGRVGLPVSSIVEILEIVSILNEASEGLSLRSARIGRGRWGRR